MEVSCVKLSTWTSSFRYPNLISGYQPTLDVPPVSTVLGLINAAAGQYLEHTDFRLGYYFEYKYKATDLETIYQIEAHDKRYPLNKVKSNVIPREFLFECDLFMFLEDERIANFFRQPYYQLLLGRSGDLAHVEFVRKVQMKKVSGVKIAGQVVPFEGNYLAGQIQALPTYFTNTIPRKNIGTQPFTVISHLQPVDATMDVYNTADLELKSSVYFHTISV